MNILVIIGCVIGGIVIGLWIGWRIFKSATEAAVKAAMW